MVPQAVPTQGEGPVAPAGPSHPRTCKCNLTYADPVETDSRTLVSEISGHAQRQGPPTELCPMEPGTRERRLREAEVLPHQERRDKLLLRQDRQEGSEGRPPSI